MKGTALKIIPKFGNEAHLASYVLKAMLSRIRHVTRELEAQVEPLGWQRYGLIYRFRRRPATVKLISVGGDRHRTGNNTANASACYGIIPTYGELLAPNLPARDQASDQPASSSPDLVTDQPRTPSGNLVTPRLTKLTDHQQRKAIKRLKKLNLIRHKVKGNPPRRYFMVNFNISYLKELLEMPMDTEFLKK